MQAVTTRTVQMYLDEKNEILFITVLPDAEFTLENTRHDREVSLRLTVSKKVKVLIDGNCNFSSTTEGLAYAASPDANSNRKAVAFVSDSLASSMIANFFKNFNKPGLPYSIFKTREEALSWLKTI